MAVKKSSVKSRKNKSILIRPQILSPVTHSSDSFIDDFRRMQERMDVLFDHFWEAPFYSPFSSDVFRERLLSAPRDFSFNPSPNIWENEKELGLSVELPGMEKKDIQLNITPHSVEIRAEKKHEQKRDEKGTHAWERTHASFYRSFPLPSHADASRAKAHYENGILRIVIPKTKSLPSNARKLEIE